MSAARHQVAVKQYGVEVAGMCLLALGLRAMVAMGSFSGKGAPPMHGDFEAQRHWMEVTVNLPPHQWYVNGTHNDLQYWGLDYPPLTAYVSWVWGKVAQGVHPDMVQLYHSRGAEDVMTVTLMRSSVLVTEGIVYLAAAAAACLLLPQQRQQGSLQRVVSYLGLLSPVPLLLIDHGHFQYNGVCLGLVLAWVVGMAAPAPRPSTWPPAWEIAAAAAFVLALNFKQMALHFAPIVFMAHLSAAVAAARTAATWSGAAALLTARVLMLGCIVLAVQAAMVLPLCMGVGVQECGGVVGQLLHRVFPFARGLFEDKVANVWCTMEPLLKVKAALAAGDVALSTVLAVASSATLAAAMPGCLAAWRAAPALRKAGSAVAGATSLVTACVLCSLSFFLASFQVHEKTVLLPGTLAALLDVVGTTPAGTRASAALQWTAVISMGPLLVKDGLGVQLVALGALQAARLAWAWSPAPPLQAAGMAAVAAWQVGLAVAAVWVPGPDRLPDLWPFLLAALSCAVLCGVWAVLAWGAVGQLCPAGRGGKQKQS